MSTGSIPGFAAEASLYQGRYRDARTRYGQPAFRQRGELQKTVFPQAGGPGWEGWANCIIDCRDLHPTWTLARCRASCRDPGGTPGSGGYGPYCVRTPPDRCT